MAETDPVTYFKSEIKRLNYYNSQFLVETDFNDEQLYHKQMRRFHNRALHTWGIVEGLQVERVPDASKVTVAPGIAIDRLGQEIVLPEKSSPIALDTFDKGTQVYITIKYTDVKDPADQDTSNQQTDSDRYSRWRERPELNATATEPAADAPEMVLAVVKLDNAKAVAEVSPTRRRYAGSRIGSSGDGKEFGIYADMAGAWHFYDGVQSADRLTIDEKGNVGIGTLPSAARLSVQTTPGPYDGALMDFVVSQYRLSLRSKAPARDVVAYHFDLVNNLGRFDSFLVFDRGNVGIGMTTMPSQKLQVSGTIYSDSGGFMFPDNTTQTTSASTARIPAENVAAGSFGAKVGGGAYTFPAQLYWGNNAARTETKDDASTIASKSGFFETAAPVNYYPGATGWQHLIEARHSNDTNNYALQIAGSFSDQNLYTRKTNGNGVTAWSQFILANSSGNVGIGTNDPGVSKLKIAKSATDFAHFRFAGTDTGMGEFEIVGWAAGWNINTRTAGKHLYLNRDVTDNSDVIIGHFGRELVVKGNTGNVGVLASAPSVKLAVGGNGGDVYATDVWIERNIHVQGNEGLNQGGRGRMRVGTAWAYVGLYAEPSSTGSKNDLILGASSDVVRIGPDGGGLNLRVSGAISCGGKIGFKTYWNDYISARDNGDVRRASRLDIWEQFTLEMACSREFKENISNLTAAEALHTLRNLNPVKYDYKGERAFRQNLGFIAEEMPDNLASVDRKTISPFEVVPVLTRVVKEQQKSIARLEETVRALQNGAGREVNI